MAVVEETAVLAAFDMLVERISKLEAVVENLTNVVTNDQKLGSLNSHLSGEFLVGRPCTIHKLYDQEDVSASNRAYLIRTRFPDDRSYPDRYYSLLKAPSSASPFFRLQPDEVQERVLRGLWGDAVYDSVKDTVDGTPASAGTDLTCDGSGLPVSMGGFDKTTLFRDHLAELLLKHDFGPHLVGASPDGWIVLHMPDAELGEALQLADRVFVALTGVPPTLFKVYAVPSHIAAIASAHVKRDYRTYNALLEQPTVRRLYDFGTIDDMVKGRYVMSTRRSIPGWLGFV